MRTGSGQRVHHRGVRRRVAADTVGGQLEGLQEAEGRPDCLVVSRDLAPTLRLRIGEELSCAPPAIANAVVDALAHLGVRHIDIPITPEKVWTILREKG